MDFFYCTANGGLAMDIEGGVIENGTNVWIWEANGNRDSQGFQNPAEREWHPIRMREAPNMCLDIAGNVIEEGTKVILYEYAGTDNQLWHFDGSSIYSKAKPDFVIDITGGNLEQENGIQIWSYNGSEAQVFDRDGDCFRVRANPGLANDIEGAFENETQVWLWEH